jgi:hypothetical protein
MHAAMLGVAMSLLGVKVGWDVNADRSVVYVIQLDAGDMDRFRADGLIESDIPPQVKNVRRVRIELATLFSVPPVQTPLTREEAPPRGPAASSTLPASPAPPAAPSSEASKRQGSRLFGSQGKTPDSGTSKLPDFLARPDEKQGAKGKLAAPAEKSGAAEKMGKKGEPAPQAGASSRPWLPLVFLCGSLGANVYFFWMWMDARGRYRRLVQRQRRVEEVTNGQ